MLDETSVPEHQRAARLAQMYNYDKIPSNIDPLVKEKLLKRKDAMQSFFIIYMNNVILKLVEEFIKSGTMHFNTQNSTRQQ